MKIFNLSLRGKGLNSPEHEQLLFHLAHFKSFSVCLGSPYQLSRGGQIE